MKERLNQIRGYILKHDNIADLGIGKGYYYSEVPPRNVVGIDEYEPNLAKVNKSFPYIKTYIRDITDTGLPDKSFELVVMTMVLEHIENLEPAIAEAKRICKPDGYFLIGLPIDSPDSSHGFGYHKFHHHPTWNTEDLEKLAVRFGKLIETKKSEKSWLIYIKNV